MSIDPHADEEAEEKERKGPERSKEAHLSRGCQQDPHGEKLQCQACELVPKLGDALPNPELQEIGMVPKRRRGQARRAGAACIKSFAHQSGDNVSQEAEMLISGAGHRSPAAPQRGYSLHPGRPQASGASAWNFPA